MKYQVIILDGRDYINTYQDFAGPSCMAEMLTFITRQILLDSTVIIKIRKWES